MKLSHTLKQPSQPKNFHNIGTLQKPYQLPNKENPTKNSSPNSNIFPNSIEQYNHTYSASQNDQFRHNNDSYAKNKAHTPIPNSGRIGSNGIRSDSGCRSGTRVCPYENSSIYSQTNDRINQFSSVIGLNLGKNAMESLGNYSLRDQSEQQIIEKQGKINELQYHPNNTHININSNKSITQQNSSTHINSFRNQQKNLTTTSTNLDQNMDITHPYISVSSRLKQQILQQLQYILYENKIQSANSLKQAIIKLDQNMKRQCLTQLNRQFLGLSYLDQSQRRFIQLQEKIKNIQNCYYSINEVVHNMKDSHVQNIYKDKQRCMMEQSNKVSDTTLIQIDKLKAEIQQISDKLKQIQESNKQLYMQLNSGNTSKQDVGMESNGNISQHLEQRLTRMQDKLTTLQSNNQKQHKQNTEKCTKMMEFQISNTKISIDQDIRSLRQQLESITQNINQNRDTEMMNSLRQYKEQVNCNLGNFNMEVRNQMGQLEGKFVGLLGEFEKERVRYGSLLRELDVHGGTKSGQPNCNSIMLLKKPRSMSFNNYISNNNLNSNFNNNLNININKPAVNSRSKTKPTSISQHLPSITIDQQTQPNQLQNPYHEQCQNLDAKVNETINSNNTESQVIIQKKIEQKLSIQNEKLLEILTINVGNGNGNHDNIVKSYSNKSLTFSISSMGDIYGLDHHQNTSSNTPNNHTQNPQTETTTPTVNSPTYQPPSLKQIKSSKYIIDTDNYLMDDCGNYLLDCQGKQIRLSEDQILMLRESNVIRYDQN